MGRRRRCVVLGAGLLTCVGWLWGADARKPEADEPRGPVITPSVATTKFTAPLDAEGYVDFAQALNRELGQGVRPEENAVIPFLRAMGPCDGNREIVDLVLKELGQPAWQPGGLDFQSLHEAHQRLRGEGTNPDGPNLLNPQEELAAGRPWIDAECPDLLRLLHENEAELAAISEALRRPKWYRPLVRRQPEDNLIAFLLPDVQEARDVARQLRIRANWHLGHGRLEPALEDILTMHRQGRHLMTSGATLIEALVGIAIDAIAGQTGNGWATHPDQTPELLAKYRTTLLTLPPLDNMARQIDLAERSMGLDIVQSLARGKGPTLSELTGAVVELGDDETAQPLFNGEQLLQLLIGLSVDWNVAMTTMNRSYDEIVQLVKIQSRTERDAVYDRFEARLMATRQDAGSLAGVARNLFSSNRRRGENFAEMLSGLLFPAVAQTAEAVDRTHMRRQALLTLLAAKEYQLRHEAYPASMELLVPEYLPAVPVDRYTTKPLRYVSDGSTLKVYSLGPNGRDDGGPPFTNERDDLGYADPPAP
jgi:hypothetical protein